MRGLCLIIKARSIMRKKLISLIICAAVLSAALPAVGCDLFHVKKAPVQWEHNVTVDDDGESVNWKEVDGADYYDIYVADGAFAEYSFITSQRETCFNSDRRYAYYRVDALDASGEVISSESYSFDREVFGDNVHVYSPEDDMAAIQRDVDEFYNSRGQFSSNRYAALFKAGDYGELDLKMSYYMTFAGLGKSPEDVVIGKFNTKGELSGGNATCNFWCGIENVTVDSDVQWAVSQATDFRRMKVNGGMYLTDRNGNTAWGSGGFISDTLVTGTINAGNQQQWLTRNSQWGKWTNCDINMVYSGCEGAFADSTYVWPQRRVTNLPTTTVMSEKPFLIFDDGYYVCVPELKRESKGISWERGFEGTVLPLSDFYVARADKDTAETVNAALEEGKDVLFTPGIYDLDEPISVNNPDTLLFGMGLASLRLTQKNGDSGLKIADVDGVRVSGLMIDADEKSSTLMQIGGKKTGVSHADNPVILNDVYFRIGGAANHVTSVDVALEINSNDVIGDNFWVWRADHGSGVGWDINRATNGVIVNGDNVTVYGLMVEHFQEYQTIWKGENGFVAFYQSETPYDPPTQDSWLSEWKGERYEGWASYKVDDGVQKHTAYGIGVYYVASSRLKNVFNLDHGIELPSNPEINVQHMAIANFLTYGGGIRHIVNGYGESLMDSKSGKKQFTSFIGGEATA